MNERAPLPVSAPLAGSSLPLAGGAVPVLYSRHRRARRYILRLDATGCARVTVPRTGTLRGAWEFVQRHTAWLERQLRRHVAARDAARPWGEGSSVLFRGETVPLRGESAAAGVRVSFADQALTIPQESTDWRPAVETHLWRLAKLELPLRLAELAPQLGVTFRRVTIRNQRSRFGSCSVKGNLSLHWRLLQMPPAVRDYVIFHELAHRREMNHSPRFWDLVARVCPHYREARAWLRAHKDLLRGAMDE